MNLQEKAFENCKNILIHNYKISKENKTIIFYDENTLLSKLLLEGYSKALDFLKFDFESYNFHAIPVEKILEITSKLKEKDLVILIQSNSFRVSSYRWRNILHEAGLKVIEHAHMEKNEENEIETYINSLTYDLPYYLEASKFLKEKLNNSKSLKIISCSGKILEFSSSFDEVFENLAYFDDKKNWGTRFPVGEVLTESLDLSTLNGEFEIYAFPDNRQYTHIVKPFSCIVKNGFLISHNGPQEFEEVFQMIKAENEEGLVYIRELGLGLNRYIKKDTRLGDISSFERLEGVHFSLGMKHGIYDKKLWPKYGKKFYQRYHVDIFLDVKEILINDEKIYDENKGYLLN